jgi:hypothetical protein|nr:MAG TPA: Integrase [Caudoviricetes sp.]
MPIYKRNNVWYIDIWTESGSRIRQSAGTKNQQEAQRLHDKLKHELWQQAKVGEMPKRLWEEAALRWLHEKKDKKAYRAILFVCAAFRFLTVTTCTNSPVSL